MSQQINNLIFQNPNHNLFVALSGGLDSQVLLHALVALNRSELKITAVHVNHNLSPNAHMWTKHCQTECKKLRVKLIIKQIDVKSKIQKGHSVEAVARELRYEVFRSLLKPGDSLLTAHHLDDQAETLLLQLFRGAGSKGLSAMPESMPLGKGVLLRPLLKFSRADLHNYAKQNKLTWVEDESNLDLKFDRNYIRRTIMPKIKTRWPGIAEVLARSAHHFAQTTELLENLATSDLKKLAGTKPNTLSQKKLLKLTYARRNNVLRYWLHTLNLPTPPAAKLENIYTNILQSRSDAMPKVSWTGVEVRRYRDDLYAIPPLPKIPAGIIIPWPKLNQPLVLPCDLGTLRWSEIKLTGVKPTPTNVTVRFRFGQERIQLPNRQGSRSLKNLFQELGVPTWERSRVPLIYSGDQIIAVGNLLT